MIGRTNCTQKSGSPSEFVNIQMLTNQAEHSNLNGAVLTMSYETYSKQYTWDGKEITFSVPAHVSCTIEFPEVEGYKKPDNITFVAVEGNSRTIEAEYKAELVKVNVTSSNGSAVSGATLTINGKQQTWNGTEIRQLVPFGTQYSVVAGAVEGFGTPSTQTFTAQNLEREVSVVYIASSLKVNILSNQGTDAAIANVKATVKYGSASVQVANGGTVNLPTNSSVTISFPEVADYKKPADITYTHTGGLVEKSGTYQCELLTVNVSADSGSVSGFEVTISKQETVGVATKYTKLEYIESNGTQYINTGFVPNQDTRLAMDYQVITHPSNGWSCLFGSRKTPDNKSSYALWLNNSSLFAFYYSSSNSAFPSMGITGRYLIEVNKNTATIGDKKIAITYSNFDCVYPLYLSAVNSAGSLSSPSSMRIYSCQIYDNGTLVRDYIPALRSDGIAGLYDAANDTFTASSGSANFIAGGEQKDIIATQTTVTGTYKIPFGTSYTISATNITGYITPNAITRIASQKTNVVEMQYEDNTIRDLSKFDIYGNAIEQTTANCYIVKKARTYKFPLVFGNALKNGKTNQASYTKSDSVYSNDFVDYNGTTINSPYIENVSGTAVKASLTIADTDGVFVDISIVDGSPCRYIQFRIVSVPSEGANGIISIIDGNFAVWSWHIWVWPHDLTPVEITNSTGVKYNIMPTNLASKYDSDGVHIKNWFYQWGRPNPMLLPSAWNSTTGHTYYGTHHQQTLSRAAWIRYGIMYPTTFFYNSSSPAQWVDNIGYNLWDAARTGSGSSDNDTVKTVYDPCPAGWKVPNGNTFTGFSIDNIIGSFDSGFRFKRYSDDSTGVFFPASGIRERSDGSIIFTGSRGTSWTSAYDVGGCVHFYILENRVISRYTSYSAFGYSIRPVQDDLTKIDTI